MGKKLDPKEYWRKNLMILASLLGFWFLVSLGCGVLFVPWLNQFTLAGFKLGFWFAQQGAILFFLLIIFIYIVLMNRLEKELDTKQKP